MTIAIAVKKGKFQIQHVTYAANGKSTVVAQSGWLPSLEVAQLGKSYLEKYDQAHADYCASGDEAYHDRMDVWRAEFRELVESYKCAS